MKISKLFVVIFSLLIAIIGLHCLFLNADPFGAYETGRGPFTDEGWHTLQLRNWINHHGFQIGLTDSFLKTPLFNVLLLPLLVITQKTATARFLVVLISISPVLVFALNRSTRIFSLLLLLLFSMHPVVFCYSHYCMPEMCAISATLLAFLFFYKHFETHNHRFLIAANALLYSSFLLKLQFAPELGIGMAYTVLYGVQYGKEKWWHSLKWTASINALLLLLFLIFWYWPNHELFEYFYQLLTANQFLDAGQTWDRAKYYYSDWLMLQPYWKPYVYLFYLSCIFGMLLQWFTKTSNPFKVFFWCALAMVVLETHVFAAAYIPLRYVLPIMAAALIVISIVFAEIISHGVHYRKMLFIGCFVILLIYPITNSFSEIKRIYAKRTYQIRDTKVYLATHAKPTDKVLGNWGATLFFGLPNEVRPISYGVEPWKQNLYDYQPQLIITETSQQESNEVFKKSNFPLQNCCDTLYTTSLSNYPLVVLKRK